MLKQNESNWNIEKLAGAEVSDAIRYLDPDGSDERLREGNSSALAIWVIFVALVGLVVFIAFALG